MEEKICIKNYCSLDETMLDAWETHRREAGVYDFVGDYQFEEPAYFDLCTLSPEEVERLVAGTPCPERMYQSTLESLQDVVWEDVVRIHPMLDFTDKAAYIAVSINSETKIKLKNGTACKDLSQIPFMLGSDGTFCPLYTQQTASHQRLALEKLHIGTVPDRWKKTHLKRFIEGSDSLDIKS